MNFIIRNVSDYISKVFTLVSSRNCVMHCNSLEILIRFYDPKNHQIRRNRNKRIFVKMIDYLSTEKQEQFENLRINMGLPIPACMKG